MGAGPRLVLSFVQWKPFLPCGVPALGGGAGWAVGAGACVCVRAVVAWPVGRWASGLGPWALAVGGFPPRFFSATCLARFPPLPPAFWLPCYLQGSLDHLAERGLR